LGHGGVGAPLHGAEAVDEVRDARLRAALGVVVEDGRDQSEVAASHGVSWPTVQRAVVAHGAAELGEPEPAGGPR
jgi:hypothetical protein